jgi:hypothetical protein
VADKTQSIRAIKANSLSTSSVSCTFLDADSLQKLEHPHQQLAESNLTYLIGNPQMELEMTADIY